MVQDFKNDFGKESGKDTGGLSSYLHIFFCPQIESKRVQYRKYLERAGVIDALSKALIKLYEEQNKPEDAIRFVRKFMCESCPDDAQYDIMKNDLEEARSKLSKMEQELERLRSQM